MSSAHDVVNITEKRLIVEILELYKDFPCLWDTSHSLYCNKEARNQALDVIVEKYKTCYPRATRDDARKKIEHLRAAYRRERNKVESSKSAGAGLEDVHTPSLWYYPYLTFLHEKTIQKSQGIDNTPGTSDSNSEELTTKKKRSSTKRQNTPYKKQEELIQSATKLIRKTISSEETSADAFGHLVGLQLKDLPKLQRCIVEKLIGELLFYAKLEELTMDTSINLNKSIHSHTGTHAYYSEPYRIHSLASSPSSHHLKLSPCQPSTSPLYEQPSP